MAEIKGFHVIIVAAGSGIRMGSVVPKQYMALAGVPILRRSIEVFLGLEGLKSLKVVIDSSHQELFYESVAGLDIDPPVFGGTDRHQSVKNGLEALNKLTVDDIVLIHDAARPLLTKKDVRKLLGAMDGRLAATLAVKVRDTLRYADQDNIACDKVDRENLWSIQTPQAFEYGLIAKAHKNANPDQVYSDDTTLLSQQGTDVFLVEGCTSNFKITLREDMELAEMIVKQREPVHEVRTGLGYDVHAFGEFDRSVDDKMISLCGVKIPHSRKLVGHSDADVGLHAITDALLGALSAGDIGVHFPPSDNRYKNMDSAVFLCHAMELLMSRNGFFVHTDITLICEEPKIAPYRNKIIERLSEIMNIAPDRISVKATTTERLGFTGRKEGIAAQAIVTITLPTNN